MHKIVEKCRSGVGGSGVGIPYNSTFRYTGPWHTRIAITFVRFNIFTRGFLQRFKHRLDLILSFVLSQGNFLVLSQDATFSFVTGVVGVGALARARIFPPRHVSFRSFYTPAAFQHFNISKPIFQYRNFSLS